MLISVALLAPHLPTLLVDEHRRHRTPMLDAFAEAAERLESEAPDVFVVTSARWESNGPFLADAGRTHRTITDYPGLGVEVRYDCTGHPELARAMVEAGQRAGLHAETAVRGVDSGVSVPMHFLARAGKTPVVPLALAPRPPAEHRAWGATLRSALAARPERVAFVASGMLSNNQHAWSLKREVPEARAFDDAVLDAVTRGAWGEIPGRDRKRIQRARPDAGLRHLEVLRGFLGGDLPGRVLCYEAAPGVGAALIEFEVASPAAPPSPPGGSDASAGRRG